MQNNYDDIVSLTQSNSHSNHSKKKKARKEVEVIPSDLLGFIAPSSESEEEFIKPKQRRKDTFKKQEQRKFNFRNRLRFVVDGDEVSQEDIVKFKGLSPEEWQQIQQVIFTMTINHPVICPICLNGTEEITAPQITACGHVFCAPCILRHCKVSKKQYYCPVCNEFVNTSELRPCAFTGITLVGDQKLSFVLRARESGSGTIYDSQSLQEDVTFSRFVRADKRYLIEQLFKENLALEKHLKEYISEGEELDIPYITQAMDVASEKILTIKEALKHVKKTDDPVKEGMYFRTLDQSKKGRLIHFYQEQHGRLFFLHPICNHYLCEQYLSTEHLPLTITSQTQYRESIVLDQRALRRYKYLNHLSEDTEITFVEIGMNHFLQKATFDEYCKEMERHKYRIREREEEDDKRNQEIINKRLAKKKQKEKSNYNLWPLDPSEIQNLKSCNLEENFPSLPGEYPILVHSNTEPPLASVPEPVAKKEMSHKEFFPEIGEEKVKGDKKVRGKRSRKRDQQDITGMMFQTREDDQ